MYISVLRQCGKWLMFGLLVVVWSLFCTACLVGAAYLIFVLGERL